MGTLPLARIALIALLATAACAPDDWRYHPFPDDASADTPSTDIVDAPDVAPADVPVTPDITTTDASDVTPVDVLDAPSPDAPDVTPVDVIDAPSPDVSDVPAVDVIDVPPPDAPPPTLRVLRGGITATGPLVSPALRVTGSLESVHRTCTPDRSLCVTGGIAP
ncbi:MAG: hypothetical protein U0326_42705 [Polyangiales bacterium]